MQENVDSWRSQSRVMKEIKTINGSEAVKAKHKNKERV